MSFVTHLESTAEPGVTLPHDRLQSTHGGKPLLVRYDLEAVGRAMSKGDLPARGETMWRWRELLPVGPDTELASLGETWTPILDCPRLAKRFGVGRLRIKDESRLPGGSFKARGMAMAVTKAREYGAKSLAVPTAGNAGGAMAAYGARAGLPATVFMPVDTPVVNRVEAQLHGAQVFLIDGLIHQCGKIVAEFEQEMGWWNLSTLKEPYRIEGKKTMGLELAEQSGWQLPDAIFYPTGGGTGLIGMWKAFAELDAIGWLESDRKPAMYACQSDGCAPIVAAFDAGVEHGPDLEAPFTAASGLRVPKALGDFLVIRAVRESCGRAMATPEVDLACWTELVMREEGIALCPESAACIGALDRARREGSLSADADVLVFNTGATQKYVEFMAEAAPEAPRCAPGDWRPEMMVRG